METTARPVLAEPIITATTGNIAPFFEGTWPAEYLEGFTDRADPLADRVIDLLYAEGRADAERTGDVAMRPRRAFQFLSHLINQLSIPDPEKEHPFPSDPDYSFSPEVREALRTMLARATELPPWVDLQMLNQGQRVFSDNPLIAYPLLALLSLPMMYTCGRGGTPVLVLTDQISVKVRRRLVETGTLIMEAMRDGCFTQVSPNSKLTNPLPGGIEAILRVRLLHAVSRTIIYEFWQDGIRDRAKEANKPESEPSKVRQYHGMPADQTWREEWGKPIHQQYLAGVLMSFSYLNLYGLERLGAVISDSDKRAYMHVWNVIGHVLGIENELLERLEFPRTGVAVYQGGKPVHDATGEEMVSTGRALYKRVLELNRANDDEGARNAKVLTAAIMDYLSSVLRRRLSFAMFLRLDRLPVLLSGMLLSEADRELVGVQITWLDQLCFPVLTLIFKLRRLVQKAAGPASHPIAQFIFKYMQEENEEVYDELREQQGVRYPGIPEEFQRKWGILTTPE